MRRIKNIAILPGDVAGNLGDLAIALSTLDQLKKTFPGAHVYIAADEFRNDEIEMAAAVTRIPKGPFSFIQFVRTIRKSDLVICGGGGLFQDDDSRIKMPYWGLRVALARLLGARIIGNAIGVGPLKHRLSRLFARLAFACMDTISVRDPEAMKVASELSGRKIHLVPDPALALKPSPNYMAENLLKQFKVPLDGSPLIGVAARKWFHTRGNFIPHKYAYRWGLVGTDGEHECRKMVQRLAGVLDRIVEAHSAYVVFLPTYNVAHEGDDRICQSVQDHMQSNRTSLIRTAQPRLYKAVTGRLDLVLGSRMHPAILAAGMGTPVVGLSYNPKFAGFFQLIGRKDLCLPIDDLLRLDGPDRLYQMMNASIRNRRSSKKVVEDLILNFEAFYGMMEC